MNLLDFKRENKMYVKNKNLNVWNINENKSCGEQYMKTFHLYLNNQNIFFKIDSEHIILWYEYCLAINYLKSA